MAVLTRARRRHLRSHLRSTSRLAHPSASWRSGVFLQRQSTPQAAPGSGQPRPTSYVGGSDRPRRACSRQVAAQRGGCLWVLGERGGGAGVRLAQVAKELRLRSVAAAAEATGVHAVARRAPPGWRRGRLAPSLSRTRPAWRRGRTRRAVLVSDGCEQTTLVDVRAVLASESCEM